MDDYLRFVVFLAVIGFVYIWNSHLAEKQIKERDKLKAEAKAVKAEYFIRKAELGAKIRYTSLLANIDSIGLYKPEQAPYKLKKKKK